jgi:hypothetical protein
VSQDQASIRFSDESQETPEVQAIAEDVAKILTPNEEILYVARQNAMALSVRPDAVVATSNRVILYQPQVLGRLNFSDFQWQDVANVKLRQGSFSSEFLVDATDGRAGRVGELDKEQSKRLYGICQQMEQEWREKRRVREMEEARARSGGIHMEIPRVPAASQTADSDDSVARLA